METLVSNRLVRNLLPRQPLPEVSKAESFFVKSPINHFTHAVFCSFRSKRQVDNARPKY